MIDSFCERPCSARSSSNTIRSSLHGLGDDFRRRTPLVEALKYEGAISNRYIGIGVARAVEEIEGTTLASAWTGPGHSEVGEEMLSVGEETVRWKHVARRWRIL